ncbi:MULTISPECIES: hybrid sensor histidine kinase/response regulator [Arthrospira]|jgi:signal transduction histidine kinase|uniref:histidine kinase n=1 Tax=Limnospira platensis NIES-46 TaxID=1236695 RepID=A0A5M3TEA0_LIMPL|nr:hybrid sensor histidine kinase/response regulator [Arthrospira platensis]AMW30457.1 two-component system sensor histidine kinase/response regulator [Arthrospira platensis YZ]KDR57941.1 chemotaxis protein CheY [Arthrospira platensis str. Paraca]MBD2710821.1 hybrid sensor histidine kinase/response regulator [Arthrospira platensis FACHB-835]MDF2207599.1 response regulator [Arthrospira platensis NCB002]MDT9183225.1 response regulator [Limnospira sp. PMC 289.06]MDT9295322.1 response regulator [
MAKVLVIEDEETIRENLVELLEIEDFDVISAENGKLGVQQAHKHLPDLILCDVMMPELDGYGVLKELRSHMETATIPFIFLTAKADRDDLREGMNLGADDYLTKPCSMEELLTAIAIRLEKQSLIKQQSEIQMRELRENITHSLPHELRTPLNGIISNTELLLSNLDLFEPDEIKEILQDIRISGRRLYRLIINFLLYADLEIIGLNVEKVRSLRSIQVKDSQSVIIKAATQQAQEHQRETDLEFDLENATVQMAANQLEKLVVELIDNACKFSEPGTPIQVISQVGEEFLLLKISDRGRGMTPEQVSKIGAHIQFERKLYEQQGSGLGLSIIKCIVELHGGQWRLESEPNQQTTISLELPLGLDVLPS